MKAAYDLPFQTSRPGGKPAPEKTPSNFVAENDPPTLQKDQYRTGALSLLLLWLLPAGILLLRSTLEWLLWQRRMLKQKIVLPEGLPMPGAHLLREFQLPSSTRLMLNAAVSGPLTYGGIKPVIALPLEAVEWTEDRLRVVFLHESVHIKRKDFLINLFIRLACVLHWFNPLVWLLAGQARLECERSCDEAVVRQGLARNSYAGELRAIARQCAPAPARLSIAHPPLLKERFQTLLNPSDRRFRYAPTFTFIILAGLGLLVSLQFQTSLPILFSREEQLVRQIGHGPNALTRQIIQTLVRRKATASAQAIIPLLSDEHPEVRASAAWALGHLKSEQAVSSLAQRVSDPQAEVQEFVLLSLAEFGYANTFYSITPLLDHPKRDVRKAALWALNRIGCLPAFYQTSLRLNDPDPEIRALARHFLDNWNKEKLRDWLTKYLAYPAVPAICNDSLDGIIRLDQTGRLVDCLAGNKEATKQQLNVVFAEKDSVKRIKLLKAYLGI